MPMLSPQNTYWQNRMWEASKKMSEEITMIQRLLPWIASFLAGGLSGVAGSKVVLSQYGKNIHDHEIRMRKMEEILAKLDKIEGVQKTVSNGHERRIDKLEQNGGALLTENMHRKICEAANGERELRTRDFIVTAIKEMEGRLEGTMRMLHSQQE